MSTSKRCSGVGLRRIDRPPSWPAPRIRSSRRGLPASLPSSPSPSTQHQRRPAAYAQRFVTVSSSPEKRKSIRR
ncbi:hypothetical protein BHE74_00041585 [Ensete ventricosum]|nr:hypothetical protein BHE74_00041585 [Ensete ventricosum]RZR92168.1 hypothetical protein BHM03_00020426 [Ensete ventricosum]